MTVLPMHLVQNTFKTSLQGRQARIGLWLALANAYAAEVCAGAGFDWLLIDGEHAPNDLRSTMAQLQVAALHGVPAMVRPPAAEAWMLKQLLDAGAQTLLLPMIDTPEQAAAAMRAVRYPPEGIRGVGANLARASQFGRIPRYAQQANAQACVFMQIESPTAVQNAAAIAEVEGVDGIFIGPGDLAATMGHLGNPAHPEVQAAIEATITQVSALGKAVGIVALDAALARRYIALGCTVVAVATDVGLLGQASQAVLGEFRPAGDATGPAAY